MSTIEKLILKLTNDPLPKEIDFDDMKKYLEYYGFVLKRTKGSHNMFEYKDGRLLPVPTVNGKTVKTIYLELANHIINQQEEK